MCNPRSKLTENQLIVLDVIMVLKRGFNPTDIIDKTSLDKSQVHAVIRSFILKRIIVKMKPGVYNSRVSKWIHENGGY